MRKTIAVLLIAVVILLSACTTLSTPIKAAEIGGDSDVDLSNYSEYISNDELGKLVSYGGYISKKEYSAVLSGKSVGASYTPSFAGCYDNNGILHIIYNLFPLHYGRFIDVFGGSGSVLLGKPTIDAFEVYNDFDRNLVNLFRCMKVRPMAVIRELGFCNLNSRDDFDVIRKFFEHEIFTDDYLAEELELTEIMLPPAQAKELKELRLRIEQRRS